MATESQQYLECTATAMSFAFLTVESDGDMNYPAFPRRMMVSSDCILPLFNWDLQNLTEVQDGFVCVADLEILMDHPYVLPCREKHFLLYSFFLNEDSSYEVSVDNFLRPLAALESKTSRFVCSMASVIEYDLFRSATDFADSISLIH